MPYCTVGAIALGDDGVARVDLEECVECGACLRTSVCSTVAFYQQPLSWPRELRAQLSDPLGVHPKTGIPGRGTEGIKTNDVTDRVKPGYAGMAVEVGRPTVGARLSEVEKIAMALFKLGIEHEPANPVTFLMTDLTPTVAGRVRGVLQPAVAPPRARPAASSGSRVGPGVRRRLSARGAWRYHPRLPPHGSLKTRFPHVTDDTPPIRRVVMHLS